MGSFPESIGADPGAIRLIHVSSGHIKEHFSRGFNISQRGTLSLERDKVGCSFRGALSTMTPPETDKDKRLSTTLSLEHDNVCCSCGDNEFLDV